MAVNEELARFVRDGLASGATRGSIGEVLRGAGWAAGDVRGALASYAEVEFPIPVPRPPGTTSQICAETSRRVSRDGQVAVDGGRCRGGLGPAHDHGAVGVVGLSVALGLWFAGSPASERDRRLDQRRVEDLRRIADGVDL